MNIFTNDTFLTMTIGIPSPTSRGLATAFKNSKGRTPIRTLLVVQRDQQHSCLENVGSEDQAYSVGFERSCDRSFASSITCNSGEQDFDDNEIDELEEEIRTAAPTLAHEEASSYVDCKPFIPTRQQSERSLHGVCSDATIPQSTGHQEINRRSFFSRSSIDSPPTKPSRSCSFLCDGDSVSEDDEGEERKSSQMEKCASAHVLHLRLQFPMCNGSKADVEIFARQAVRLHSTMHRNSADKESEAVKLLI